MRFTAVLGEISEQAVLYFKSWKGALTFGASRTSSNGGTLPGQKKGSRRCVEGPVLGFNEESMCNITHTCEGSELTMVSSSCFQWPNEVSDGQVLGETLSW